MPHCRKWRTVYPGCRDSDEFRSEAAAYAFVDSLRTAWVAGAPGTSNRVTVQVDEGSGWQPYELIDFAEER